MLRPNLCVTDVIQQQDETEPTDPQEEISRLQEQLTLQLYTGNLSDKEITRSCGLLNLLDPGDSVMADKGFLVQDLLKEKGCTLNIPPFLESANQFSVAAIQKTEEIAILGFMLSGSSEELRRITCSMQRFLSV